LPHQSDNPEHPSTLPQPDLNPLLNPLLAKNIGRWAEVYFTNPPEKREKAVLDLVRELERDGPIPEGAGTPRPSPRSYEPGTRNTSVSNDVDVQAQGLTCPSCGYVNRPKHKFCGRCGIRIMTGAIEEQEPRADLPVSLGSTEYPESPIFGFESTPRWQSYRLYVGAALALVVSVLGYMAWRSAQTTSGVSHVTTEAPPAVTSPATSTPQASSPKVDTSAPPQTHSTGSKPESSPPGGGAATAVTSPGEAPPKTKPANSSAAVPDSASSENRSRESGASEAGVGTPAASGAGFEELAIARDFLDGKNGRQQSRAEAVPWLWKAVAKKNIDATVLLSGLYLRGDGVPKNCEQARLLLDAAAIKGRKDAALQLRNLQAFGCQ